MTDQSPPLPTSAPPTAPGTKGVASNGVVVAGNACIDCGYDLAGLRADGQCPECGASIERSLKGDFMVHASPEYLATLHRGAVSVLTAILVQVALMFVGLAIRLLLFTYGGSLGWLPAATTGIELVSAGALLWGWWRLSTPMPSLAEKPWVDKARRWVRYLLFGDIIVLVAQVVLATTMRLGVRPPGIEYVAVAFGLFSLAIWLATYIVHGTYLAWLAKRIPDTKLHNRSKRIRWLCPLLATVGIILIGLGPLIALVIYWNLINSFRKAFKRIRQEQSDQLAAA